MPKKVLIVLDGDYRFEEPAEAQDFTFTVLVDTLKSAGFDVTRAHRDLIGEPWVSEGKVDIDGFSFSTSTDLLEFDVIWMIGHHGRNISGATGNHILDEDEIGALTRFMDAGGGVFATGDHDSIGADMCGFVPRLRIMRAWFGPSDTAMPDSLNGFPRNFWPLGADRADTVQRNPLGDYDLNNDGADDNHVYFENQSDSIPQPISPTSSPAHPILRRNGMDITVYPDHMHEGQTWGENDLVGVTNPYDRSLPAGVSADFVEFPTANGERELPQVIATGQGLGYSQRYGDSRDSEVIDNVAANPKEVNSLCVYEGWNVGVGRIVTGSTFHHYIDINLTGDSDINEADEITRTGPDAVKGQGFNYAGAEEIFTDIKTIYVNITKWLARITPKIELILERSTFSLDEVQTSNTLHGALLVTVDGLKPNDFPGGPISTLTPTATQLNDWAPKLLMAETNTGIEINAIDIDSSLPNLPDRVQRFTFSYSIQFVNENAFGLFEEFKNFQVDASLISSATSTPLTDSALIQLVKSANPFMLDLDGGNSTSWLSSDVRVFTVVEGTTKLGVDLPIGASKPEAYVFIQNLMGNISITDFEGLSTVQADSALSLFPMTNDGKKVYNFAIARVRLNDTFAIADRVRVFFRIFKSQTTAALTYRHPEGGSPVEGYRKSSTTPISIPGVTSSGNEWLSFPFFAENRHEDFNSQNDGNNVKNISPTPDNQVSTFFGALIDNNLENPYLPSTPISGGPDVSLPTLLMGEHQCLVAQIEFLGTPIPDGARPNTSDKLSQRNLAITQIANPGINASRMAFHTFEIEATPSMISNNQLPDELMLEWVDSVPNGTYIEIFVPTWNTTKILEIANEIYPQHDLIADNEQTIVMTGGGTQYVPIPRSFSRQTGVIMIKFPLGIKKGQRFDLTIRQITNRQYRIKLPPGKGNYIKREEAIKIIEANQQDPVVLAASEKKIGSRDKLQLPKVFQLPDNKILYTDTSFINKGGDQALLYEPTDPKLTTKAKTQEGKWREVIGAFQLGILATTKDNMLINYLRLLSVFRWKLEVLPRNSPWFKTLEYYVDLIVRKVYALGGNPYDIPTTPDGNIGKVSEPTDDDKEVDIFSGYPWWPWLLLLIISAIIVLLIIKFN